MYDRVRIRHFACALAALVLLSAPASARDWADRPWLKTAQALPGEGRTVALRTAHGTRFMAYLNGPEDAATGVLLIHDRWGINPRVTAWADRLAGAGHRVLAVDLYDGREVLREGMGDFVWRQIDPVWIEANLDAALRFLGERQQRLVVSAWGKGIEAAVDLVQRREGGVDVLALYPDPSMRAFMDGLPRLPARVFRYPVPRSPVHLHGDRATAAVADEALDATLAYLSGAEDASPR
jgi:dienelactone hydrolase